MKGIESNDSTGTAHKMSLRNELGRKTIHLVMLIVPIAALHLGKTLILKLIIPLFLCALFADVARSRSQYFGNSIDSLFGKLMRKSELGQDLNINGATWMLFSIASILLVFPLEIAASSLALFIAGDAMAALIGRRFGGRVNLIGHASLAGSLAFLFFGGLVLFLLPLQLSTAAKTIGLGVGMLLEMPDGPLNDNIQVPWASAISMVMVEGVLG